MNNPALPAGLDWRSHSGASQHTAKNRAKKALPVYAE
jgi:hypothetical protein